MKHFVLISFLISACIFSRAQQIGCGLSVGGTLISPDSTSLYNTLFTVVDKSNGETVLADSTGHFQLSNACAGKIRIVITSVGYHSIDTTISVNQNVNIFFRILGVSENLNSVTVTGQSIKRDQISTAVRTTLSGAALEQMHGLSLGETLKTITGINSIQTGPAISKPVIHGVYSNRVLIVNNGVRQEGQNWGNDHAPEIDPFIATRLTVIKGAASIRFGSDAIGGVVLVEPKQIRETPGIEGEINLVGMTNGRMGAASGMIEGAADKTLKGLSWRLQGTLKKAGNFQAPNYYLGNTGFNEYDFSATLAYSKSKFGIETYFSQFDTKIGIAAASHIGTLQDLYSAFERSQPAVRADFNYDIKRPYQTVVHQLFKADAYLLLGKMGRLETVFARQNDIRKEYDADISFNDSLARLNPPDLNFQLITHTVDLIWEHPAIANKINGSLGFNFITQGNIQEGTGYQELIPNFRDYGGGVFVIEKYHVKKMLLEAGLRYDYRWLRAYTLDTRTLTERTPTYNWQDVTLNAGASYQFSDMFSMRYNFGTAWRPPQVIELFANGIHQSAASYEHGDSSLKLEKAYNNNIEFTYTSGRLQVEVGVYVNYFNNYIFLKPDSFAVQTIQGAFPSYTYTQVNALFEGLDINISYSFLKHFSISSKTTIVRARNLNIHDWLINIPADRFDNTFKYSLSSFGKMNNVFFSVNNLGVLRQTRVPPESDYVPPPPGYDLWAVSIGCSIPLFKNYMDVSMTCNNLTNVSYRDYLNRFRYFIDDLGRNFSIRITVPFDFSSCK